MAHSMTRPADIAPPQETRGASSDLEGAPAGVLEIVSPTLICGWIALEGLDPSRIAPSLGSVGEVRMFDRSDVAAQIGRAATGFSITLKAGLALHELLQVRAVFDGRYTINTPAIFFLPNCPGAFERQQAEAGGRSPEVVAAILLTGFFDPEHYRSQTGLPADRDPTELLAHYLDEGWRSGFDPHALFSTAFYLKKNADVRSQGLCPLLHFALQGLAEWRSTTPDFDIDLYFSAHGADIPAGVHPLHHYIRHGYFHGFQPVPWLDAGMVRTLSASSPRPVSLAARYRRGYRDLPAPHEALAFAGDAAEAPPVSALSGVVIVVPFYREPHLIRLCLDGLARIADEIIRADARVLAILDSPADPEAVEEFARCTRMHASTFPLEAVSNPGNLGFVGSANLGLDRARRSGRHALLLNSDCFMAPGALSQMLRALSLDPMIGFVNPRSNNATIATFPRQALDFGQHFRACRQVSHLLPELTYAPTCVGFCMLISRDVLANFGVLDVSFGVGYNEENDLVLRANRVGYRAVLANRAYAFHIGEASFRHSGAGPATNAALLDQRYPEYPEQIDAFLRGRACALESMVEAFIPTRAGRRRVLLDLSVLGAHPNGTSVMASKLTQALAARAEPFEYHVLASDAAASAHGIDVIGGLTRHPSWETLRASGLRFAHALRLGQPTKRFDLLNLLEVGATVSLFMLDTIAYDCGYLANPELQQTWELAGAAVDGFVYQSMFTRQQFERRFDDFRRAPSLVTYHSVALADYRADPGSTPENVDLAGAPPGIRALLYGEFVLVVGNHFHHKDVMPTLTHLLAACPGIAVIAIGAGELPDRGLGGERLVLLKSGDVSTGLMDLLYRSAASVIFPSFYEGFGFPILHALANGRRLFLRDNAINREITALAGAQARGQGVFFYRDYRDLTQQFLAHRQGAPVERSLRGDLRDWATSAGELAAFIDARIEAWDPGRVLLRHALLGLSKTNGGH